MSPVAAPTAALCPTAPTAKTHSNRPRARLTDVEIEILVRLLGYGCPPGKAASYLDRPVKLVRTELQRLGLGPARSSKANGDTRRAKGNEGGEPC